MLAFGPADEIALVAVVIGQQIARVFIRGIHQRVLALGQFHAHDGVVETGIGHFGVALVADADEHRIGLESGQSQHGNEQRRLVAAHSVVLFKGQAHVMRFKTRTVLFRREAHVTDVFGDMIKQRLHAFQLRGRAIGEGGHGGFHGGRHGVEMRFAEIPIPLGNRRPVRERADQHALQHLRGRRHGRFVKHAGHIIDFPVISDAAVRIGGGGSLDRTRDRVTQGDLLEGRAGGRMDLIRCVPDVFTALKNIFLRKLTRNAGAFDGLAGDGVNDIAHLHLGQVHLKHLHVRVGNVFRHLAFVDGFLGIGGDIHGHHRAIRLDHFQPGHGNGGIRQHEAEGEHAAAPAAFFREDFLVGFILALGGAIGMINPHEFFLHGGGVAIRVFRGSNLGGGGQAGVSVGQGPESTVVIGVGGEGPGASQQEHAGQQAQRRQVKTFQLHIYEVQRLIDHALPGAVCQ